MTGTDLFTLLKESKINFGLDVRYGERVEISLKDLTTFIDEYFLPRPLFEDGTPVKVGDEFALHKPSESKKINNFCVSADGIFSINSFVYDQDQRVKRPVQPEALDADGVPIELGDKLYFVEGDDTPLKCIGFDDYGNVTFTDWEKTGTIAYENPTVFTHKKPDSWEQLEEDKKKCITEYWGCQDDGEKLCCECEHSLLKTGSSCATNKYKDLFRRAKALAGIEDQDGGERTAIADKEER